jgi:hypothetical protein
MGATGQVYFCWSSAKMAGLENCTSSQKLSGSWRMPSSGVWHRVALVRTDVSEERIASIMRVTRISQPASALTLTSN